jgi:hypothetical protein
VAGTIGQILGEVPSGISPTPPEETYKKSPEELVPVNLERRPIFPDHIESELVKYCTEVDDRQIA